MPIERQTLISLLVAAALVLVGCGGEENGEEIAADPEATPTNTHVLSCEDASADVDVYFDATPNMAGFLADPRYEELVAFDLDDASPAGSSVRYYRVTDYLEGGMESADRMDARSEWFYGRGNTDLTTIVDSARTGNLSVVLTNLFQTDADINRVTRSISEKFLRDSLAVGFAAMRYSFEGTIYDIGYDHGTQWYEGDRPTYLMALGDHCAIAEFFDSTGPLLPSDARYAIFSPYAVQSPVTFDTIERTENLYQDRFEGVPVDDFTRQVTIRDRDGAASFEASVSTGPAPYSLLSSGAQELVLDVSCEETADGNCRPADQEAFQARLQGGVEGARLAVDLDPKRLRPTTYRYDIDFITEGTALPDWADAWNVDISEAEPGDFPGDRTQNLRRFIRQLQTDIEEIFRPQPGQLRVYVKVED